MAIPTLPTESEAKTQALANEQAVVTAASNAWIASTKIVIENAITNGLLSCSPFLTANVDYGILSTYFKGLGYSVTVLLQYTDPYGEGYGDWGYYSYNFASAPPPSYPSAQWAPFQQYLAGHPTRVLISWSS